MIARYKINTRADGSSLHHTVHKALGPWPFSNWSWGAVYSSSSRQSCERWIAETQFTESPEGQRLKREEEERQRLAFAATQKRRAELARLGWIWEAATRCYLNANGERVPAEVLE